MLLMITTINYAEDVLCLKAYSYEGLGRAKDLEGMVSMKASLCCGWHNQLVWLGNQKNLSSKQH